MSNKSDDQEEVENSMSAVVESDNPSMKRPKDEESDEEAELEGENSDGSGQPASKRRKMQDSVDTDVIGDQEDETEDTAVTSPPEEEKKEKESEKQETVDQVKETSAPGAQTSGQEQEASKHAELGTLNLSTRNTDKEEGNSNAERKEQNKENIEQGPIDLSKTKVNGASDVIMLSDEDEEESVVVNGFVNGHVELSPEKLIERRKMIKRLQEELRNEEAKLVLLKKLRQSQMLGHIQESGSQAKPPAQRPTQGAPPALVRNSQNARPAHTKVPAPSSYNSRGNQLSHNSQSHAPPPLVMGPRGSAHQSAHQQVRNSTSASQNVVSGYRSQAPAPQQQQPPPQPEQTPAQRQAAAKLALRKQLEKTLLQIPPPKPPPPEMNFIPSLGSGEFIMMCGLEEIVTFIKEADARKRGEASPDVKYVFNPFICVQCKTDFTPVWKREKPGSKNVICENCVTSNQKKALKQEHTNRLKSAFVKALQQEQEIELKIQQQQQQQQQRQPSSVVVTTTQQSQPQQQAPPSAHSLRSSHSSGVVGASRSLPSSYKGAPEPYLAHQNMIQAHQAASLRGVPMPLQGFNPRAMFPYGQPPKSVSDLQRQYLLDMIPRSMPQGMWKN